MACLEGFKRIMQRGRGLRVRGLSLYIQVSDEPQKAIMDLAIALDDLIGDQVELLRDKREEFERVRELRQTIARLRAVAKSSSVPQMRSRSSR